jgi:hypothetical protein
LGDEVRSGGVVIRQFDDLDAILKFDASDDFWQLVSPFSICGGVDEFKYHQLGGRRRQGSLRPHRAMTTVANTLKFGGFLTGTGGASAAPPAAARSVTVTAIQNIVDLVPPA